MIRRLTIAALACALLLTVPASAQQQVPKLPDSTHGAKFRILVTPAATSRSATDCAADAGVAITPIEIDSRAAISGSSSMCRTVKPLIFSPIRAGSASSSAAMRKPRLAKPA